MTEAHLTIQNLTIAFAFKKMVNTVVNNFHLTLSPGQCAGLVGESGSGKTMMALSILQLLPYGARVTEESRILFHDKNLLDLSERQMRTIRGKEIAMIFQDSMSALNPVLTIGQQLDESIRLHLQFSKKNTKKHALKMLDDVGIKELERCYQSYPHQLSGGQRQRAMIAIALAASPKIIIADEPTTALDVTIQAQVIDLLNHYKDEKQCALLFIGHDLSVVSQVADNITVLKKGIIVEESDANSFFSCASDDYSKQLLSAVLPNKARHQAIEDKDSETVLSADQLKVHFPIKKGILKRTVDYTKAVDGISFKINSGETLALVGESGSGKSTTAKGVLQLIKNTQGKVVFLDQALSSISSRNLRKMRANMQIIFQDPYAALNPRMLVVDCISEGLIAQNKLRGQALNNRVDELLEQVELPLDSKWRYPHEFSGGQKQRICIARALALSPKLLILDEPTSALDVSIQKQILELLDKLQQELQLSYLLITHNLSVVAFLAHKVAVMYQGKIVEQDATEKILHAPEHAYTKKLLAAVPQIKSEHS